MGNGTVGTAGFIHAITVPGGAYAEYDENRWYLTGFWDMNHTFFQYGYPDNSSLLTEFESGNGVATETDLAYDAADRVAQITFPTSTPNTQKGLLRVSVKESPQRSAVPGDHKLRATT